jgi:hypothetical protein
LIFPRKYPTVVGGLTLQHHLYFDTMADFPNLPGLNKAAKGSDAYCIEEKIWYVLNSGNVWVEQPGTVDGYGGSGGGGGTTAFQIVEFESDRMWNQIGIPVMSINFSWQYANGSPTAQAIAPHVGDIPLTQRTTLLTGQMITTDTVFTLTATGGDVTRSMTTELKFFHPIFVGLVDSATPVDIELSAMFARIAPAETFVHDFVIDDQRTAIAIHSSLPPLVDIRDTVFGGSQMSNFNVFNNVPISTFSGTQTYTVYIFNDIQNTMGLHQPAQFVW